MYPEVQYIFENYGWYLVLCLILYILLIRPYLLKIWQNQAVITQKKFDVQMDLNYQEQIETARVKMQAEYDKEKKDKELELQLPNKMTKNLKFDPINYVQTKVNRKAVVVFSKTTCPYCRKVKQILSAYRLSLEDYEIIEIDQIKHCNEVQDVLHSITGARTVPRVFINGNCIGGCDDTIQAHKDGYIEKLLRIANINFYK